MSAVSAQPLIPTGDDDKIIVKTTIEKKKKNTGEKKKQKKKTTKKTTKKKRKVQSVSEAASNRSDVLLGDQVLLTDERGEVKNAIETQPSGCKQDNDCNTDQLCIARRCLDKPPAAVDGPPLQDDPNGIPAGYVNPDDAKYEVQYELRQKKKKLRNRMFVVFACVILGFIIWGFASRDTSGSEGTGRTGDACSSNSDCESKFFCDNGGCVERDPGEILGVASSTWYWLSWGAISILFVFTLLYGLINLIGGGRTKKDIEDEEEKKEEEDRAILEEEAEFFEKQKQEQIQLLGEDEEQQKEIEAAVQDGIKNGKIQDDTRKEQELMALVFLKDDDERDEQRRRIEAEFDKKPTLDQYREALTEGKKKEIEAEAIFTAQELTREFGLKKREKLNEKRRVEKLSDAERKLEKRRKGREKANELRKTLNRPEVDYKKKGKRFFRKNK